MIYFHKFIAEKLLPWPMSVDPDHISMDCKNEQHYVCVRDVHGIVKDKDRFN